MESGSTDISQWFRDLWSAEDFRQWVLVVPTFFAAYIVIYFVHRWIRNTIQRKKDHQVWLEFIYCFLNTNHVLFFLAFSIFISSRVAPIAAELKSIFNLVFGAAVILQIGLWVNTSLAYLFKEVLSKNADAAKTTVLRAVSVVTRFIVWLGVGLLILDNFGVDITALVAGVGIGGVAVALGIQKIMGDIFASLSIVMDRPFVIGDFIIVGEYMGTVEDIGIKTTRIRSLTGERIIFSNADLLGSRIKNYSQMYRRRVAFNLSLTYETTPDVIKQAIDIVGNAIKKTQNTEFEFARFSQISNYSFDLEAVYWINSSAFNEFISIHQFILLDILENFKKHNIKLAYPVQRQVIDRSAIDQIPRHDGPDADLGQHQEF